MLTLLANVKTRLGLTELEIQYDALLAALIAAVSARFNRECQRTLGRTVDAAHEFSAESLAVSPPCYPIERVTRLELKTCEAAGWVEQAGAEYIIKRGCVVELRAPLGSRGQQARLICTGGYVLPGNTPAPGQTALPVELEQAATEQTVYWFQNRDRLGLERFWEYHGPYRQYADADLLTGVQAVLRQHLRWTI